MNKKLNKKNVLLVAAMTPAIIAGTSAVNNNAKTTSNVVNTKYLATASSLTINAKSSYEYSGTTPEITVSSTKGTVTAGTDYTVGYQTATTDSDGKVIGWGSSTTTAPTAVGKYKMTVTPVANKGLGTEPATKEFEITKADLRKATFKIAYTSTNFTGAALEPAVTEVKCNGRSLTVNTDYTVEYSNNTNVGIARAVIKAKDGSNYTESASTTFEIKAIDINSKEEGAIKAAVAVTGGNTYNGKEQNIVTTVTYNGQTLVADKDYTVKYAKAATFEADQTTPKTWGTATASKPVNAGTYKVIVTGMGNCTGTVESANFVITTQSVSGYTIKFKDSTGKLETSIPEQAYTGSTITPVIAVVTGQDENGKDIVLDSANYKLTYVNNTNVGTSATVKVEGTGNYSGEVTKTFTIKANIAQSIITIENADKIYYNFGEPVTVTPVVTLSNGTVLTAADYEIKADAYKNNKEMGTATVTITGKGEYAGTKTVSFTIKALPLVNDKNVLASGVVVDMAEAVDFDANGAKPKVEITANSINLKEGTDFTVSYENNKAITEGDNKATAKITFKGNYSGTYEKKFNINQKMITDESVIKDVEAKYEYTGSQIKPKITIEGLTEGTDYTVEYSNNTNEGTATIKVTFKGNYNGELTKTFAITTIDAKSLTVEGVKDMVYDKNKPNIIEKLVVKSGTTELKENVDYTYSVEWPETTGEATLTITAIHTSDNHLTNDSTKEVKFRVGEAEIKDVTVAATVTYPGKAATPSVTVKDGSKTLVKGTDYEVSYKNNDKVGTATVTVTGIGKYVGTVTKNFTIAKANVKNLKVSGISDVRYNPAGAKPTNMIIANGNVVLVEGTDYTVKFANYTKVGTATVTITGKGNYEGTITKTYKVVAAPIPNAFVTGITNKSYTGKAITQKIKVRAYGRDLKEGTDYTVTYKNNKNVGTATVTITGKGNYTSSKKVTFKIAIAKPSKLTTSKRTASSVTLSWKKSADKVTGYEISRSTKKNSGYKVVKTTTSTSWKNTGLASGKTYYYRVRAYVTVNGKKSYSDYVTLATASKLGSSKVTAKVSKSNVTLNWGKVSNAEGYEIYVSTKKNGTYSIAGATDKKSYTIKNMKKGTYYFKVRAYKVAGIEAIFGDYKTVTVTVK